MRMWVHRITIKQIIDIQKTHDKGIADSIYECVAAFRYFEAIECWFNGETAKAQAIVAKIRTDRFTDTDLLLRTQARIATTYRQEDPFTDTCVAAHQQQRDWNYLVNGCDSDKLAKIKARHELYRQCQPENQPKDDACQQQQKAA